MPRKKLLLWKLTRTDEHHPYECYEELVVAAYSAREACILHPEEAPTTQDKYKWNSHWAYWPRPEHVHARLIGVAAADVKPNEIISAVEVEG